MSAVSLPILDTARQYRERGWRRIPLIGKRPIGEDFIDWQYFFRDFRRGRNVGVVLGWRSGDLVDIDLVRADARDDLFEQTLGNVEEVMARSGHVVMVSDAAGIARFGDRLAFSIAVPSCDPFVAPLLCAIPIQLLA